MRISTDKIISLLFFILSVFYLYHTYQIQVFTFDENAPFNAKTFPTFLAYLGMFLSVLYVVLPEKSPSKVDHKVLDYKSSLYLVIITIVYGFVILKAGFFLSTSFSNFAEAMLAPCIPSLPVFEPTYITGWSTPFASE